MPQLAAAGITVDQLRGLVKRGELVRAHYGVYTATMWPASPEQRAMVALLAAPDGAAISHAAAAAHLALTDAWPYRIDVTFPTDSGTKGPAYVIPHRSRSLPNNTVLYRGIRTTTVARTLDDLARTTEPASLPALLRRAEFHHRLELSALTPRSKALRQTLKRYVSVHMTQSELEAIALQALAHGDVPRPDTQVKYGDHRADFVWHDVGLIVETDGYQAHGGAIAFREDRVRDRALKAISGYELIHFTYEEVVHDGPAFVAEVKAWRGRL